MLQSYTYAFHVFSHADYIQSPDAVTVYRIHNHSSVAVQYSWRPYATADEEVASAVASMINRPSQGSTYLEGDIADIISDVQPAGKTVWPS